MKRIYTIETSTGIRFTGNEKSRKRHKVYFRLKNQAQGGQLFQRPRKQQNQKSRKRGSKKVIKDKIEKIACELEYLEVLTQMLSNTAYSDTVTREDLSNSIKGIASYCNMVSREAWEVVDEEDDATPLVQPIKNIVQI